MTGKDSSTAENAVLVFPATHPAGRDFLATARERFEVAIAATSAPEDAELAGTTEQLAVLPYIYDASFGDAFNALVAKHRIRRVFSPVSAVYAWLTRFISENQLELRLIGESPFKNEMNRCVAEIDRARGYKQFANICAEQSGELTALEIASVMRLAAGIYGESNEHKLAAVISIFRSAPKGDVVEIGSLAGKSAAVLSYLARRYGIGNVLAIDPWQANTAKQNHSPDNIKVDLALEWDSETLVNDFVINTLPVGWGNLNFLRRTSEEAYALYASAPTVTTDAFGRVQYMGHISVIHIDGNHDFEVVRKDCDLWLPHIQSNGWLILDDYLWAHGDGPKQVGDDILATQAQKIRRAFVCGKALFINFV